MFFFLEWGAPFRGNWPSAYERARRLREDSGAKLPRQARTAALRV
jgi:hypothetical protein